MLSGPEMEFSVLKVHNLGANGQSIKIYQTITFQRTSLRKSPVTKTKGKEITNSNLQKLGITCTQIYI